jgi:hypothetical protein
VAPRRWAVARGLRDLRLEHIGQGAFSVEEATQSVFENAVRQELQRAVAEGRPEATLLAHLPRGSKQGRLTDQATRGPICQAISSISGIMER